MRGRALIFPAVLLFVLSSGCVPKHCTTGQCYRAKKTTYLRGAERSGRFVGNTLGGRSPRRSVSPYDLYWVIAPIYDYFLDAAVASTVAE